MATATLEDAADELLERLSDVGIASDDATVEDVTRKAVPARFVRLGAHLASDVAAVVATGCVGVDDREGVDAAVSAIYRSAANAANNPTAAAARLEQGLRRLAAALDADAAAEDERNSSSSSRVAVAVMSRLVTYVQVGTMLAKKRKRHDFPKDDDVAETDARMDAVTNENENELTNEASLDPAQRARVSERLWRVARALETLRHVDPGEDLRVRAARRREDELELQHLRRAVGRIDRHEPCRVAGRGRPDLALDPQPRRLRRHRVEDGGPLARFGHDDLLPRRSPRLGPLARARSGGAAECPTTEGSLARTSVALQ